MLKRETVLRMGLTFRYMALNNRYQAEFFETGKWNQELEKEMEIVQDELFKTFSLKEQEEILKAREEDEKFWKEVEALC